MIEGALNKEFDKFTVQPRSNGSGAAALDGFKTGPSRGLNDDAASAPCDLCQ